MSTASKTLPRKKSSQSLKDYLATSKKPSKVIGPIERHLLTRPADHSRRQDILHPSEIVREDCCFRAEYERIRSVRAGATVTPQRPGLVLQSIFDVGHAAHAKWQGYLAEMGVIYGHWSCVRCDLKWGPTTDSRCTNCGQVGLYEELSLYDDSLEISGHTDGWVVTGDEEFALEVKTIGTGTIRTYAPEILYDNDGSLEKSFGDIRSPFKGHRRQVQMYLYLMHSMHDAGLLERTPPEQAVLLYECKSNQQVKEFTVKYSPRQIQDVVDNAAIVAAALRRGRAPKCNHGGCSQCEPKEK